MATSTILENITINNPEFAKLYVDAMDASDGTCKLEKLSDAEITLANKETTERFVKHLKDKWNKNHEV